jgi:hypothetical protein
VALSTSAPPTRCASPTAAASSPTLRRPVSLRVADPVAFGFLSGSPAGITVQGSFGAGVAGSLGVIADSILISGIAGSLDPFVADFTGLSTATNVGRGGPLRAHHHEPRADRLALDRAGCGGQHRHPGRVREPHAAGRGRDRLQRLRLGAGRDHRRPGRGCAHGGRRALPLLHGSRDLGDPSQAGPAGGDAGSIHLRADRVRLLDGSASPPRPSGPGGEATSTSRRGR